MALDGYLSPEEQRLQKQQKNLKATGKWANVAGTSLSWIPFVGPFLALAGAGIKAGTDIAAGKAQKREALVKEQRAAQLQASPIAPEFYKAQQAAQFAQLGGLGGYEQYRRNIEQSQAQSLNQAMQSATGGEQALVAASNIAAQSSAEQAKLAAQDAQQRAILGQESRAALETIGKQKTDAEIRKIAEQDKLRRAAAAFANAGTGNIMQGISGIADTTAQLGRTIYNTAQTAQANKVAKGEADANALDATQLRSDVNMANYQRQQYASERGEANSAIDSTKFAPQEEWMLTTPAETLTFEQKQQMSSKLGELRKDPVKNRVEIMMLQDAIDANAKTQAGS